MTDSGEADEQQVSTDPGDLGAAQLEHRRKSRRRFVEHLMAMPGPRPAGAEDREWAQSIIDHLFVWPDVEDGEPCACGCHPSLPSDDFHDFGFDCPCRHTRKERKTGITAWLAGMDEFWDSDEGRRIRAEREAEESDLEAWLANADGVEVTSHGGLCPEQWEGTVDGRSFYFRERHDQWRIELDIRPTGRTYRAVTGTDDGGGFTFAERDIEVGDVIAEGTVTSPGYGQTPTQRVVFILGVIRTHNTREHCQVHRDPAGMEQVFGDRPSWCPACGDDLRPAG